LNLRKENMIFQNYWHFMQDRYSQKRGFTKKYGDMMRKEMRRLLWNGLKISVPNSRRRLREKNIFQLSGGSDINGTKYERKKNEKTSCGSVPPYIHSNCSGQCIRFH